MKNAFLVGQTIYLRALSTDDLNGPYFDWLNNSNITRFLDAGRYPNTMASMEQFLAGVAGSDTDIALAICINDTEQHVGNIKLGEINYFHRRGVVSILIGEQSFQGKGIATEAHHLLLDYAFKRLGLNRIEAGVLDGNLGSRRLYEKLGFASEGIRKQFAWANGRYQDEYLYALLSSEFLTPSES